MNDAAPVVLRGVTRAYRFGAGSGGEAGGGTVLGLDDVSLSIDAGEYVSLMGPSGSGKSTLLNVLGLLDRPDAGEYRLFGADTRELSEAERADLRQRRIGFVFQSFHLIPRLTALENVALPLLLAGVPGAERNRRAEAALAAVGLADRAAHRPDQLSGGQRQRVAIARATVTRPALLLADEPTGNLDSHSGTEVVVLLEALNIEGITLVVVTHDAALGARARRRVRLHDGQVVADERAVAEAGNTLSPPSAATG